MPINDLFDVSTLLSFSCYQGLFVDRNMHLWTKSSNGRYRRLANQLSMPSGEYPYTLAEMRSLLRKSQVFIDFLKSMRAAIDEHKADSLKGKFVIAIIDGDGLPVFQHSVQVFDTREEADKKLIHYKQLNPTGRFCLFECKGELKSVGVVME